MKCDIKVLIGDNSCDAGMLHAKYLNTKGIETLCRRNDFRLILNEVEREKPELVMLYVPYRENRTAELITEIKKRFDNIKIMVLSYITSENLCHEILTAGAERYVVMPISLLELYTVVAQCLNNAKLFRFDVFVSEYLMKNNFNINIKGFNYLCTAVCICLINPEYLSDVTGRLYERIADIYNTKPELVERSLRHEAELVFKSGADRMLLRDRYFVNSKRRLTNYELIAGVADAFAEEFNIFGENRTSVFK